MNSSNINLLDVDAELQQQNPQDIIRHALENHDEVAISFSGAEDVVLIDMATRIRPDVAVFCLDTGRLHNETYAYIEEVRKHYSLSLEVLFPHSEAVEKLVKQKGLFSFYLDNHQECCAIRKVGPLRKHLLKLNAWITGQRKDQSPDTRATLPVIQKDRVFARANDSLTKYNPLANWRSDDVWQYIQEFQVPYNPLHEQGFKSIGCEPCTRPVHPGQHEREGRWWWEEATKKECGLHLDKTQN